ncbi:hypothetical protein CR513_58670, partial [Mucuna pruriens]
MERKLKLSNLIDYGDEYYDRYDESREQHPRPFALFPKECEIVPQCTMSGKPNMNGVAEQQNQTLKDMGNVRILEEVEFKKEENIRNVDFEEEAINDIVIEDNVQTIVPNVVPKQDYDDVLPQTPINFEMKDLGEASFGLGIQILRDRSQGILRYLSNPRIQHWKEVKREMRYLNRTNDTCSLIKSLKNVKITNASHLDTSTCWLEELSLEILYSNNNRSSTKSKFIDIKFLVVKKEFRVNSSLGGWLADLDWDDRVHAECQTGLEYLLPICGKAKATTSLLSEMVQAVPYEHRRIA